MTDSVTASTGECNDAPTGSSPTVTSVQSAAQSADGDWHQKAEKPIDTLRTSLKDWIDISAKVAFGALAACYVIGLLVVNFYLRQYGLTQFGLLQVEYVMTGIVWLFLVAFATFAAKYAWHRASAEISDWRAGGKRFWSAVGAVIIIVLLPSFFFQGLSLLTDGSLNLLHWKGYLLGVGLAIQGTVALRVLAYLRLIALKVRDKSILAEKDHTTIYNALYTFVGFLGLIPTCALYLYPLLSPTFAGARASDISMVIKSEQREMMNALGFSITGERVTLPVKLILETSEYLLVLPPSQQARTTKVRAIRIRKDLVDAILYNEPKTR